MRQSMETTPGPIPAPPDFPVEWEEPGDEALFWTHDRLHNPRPTTPLEFSMTREAFFPAGFPIRRINTYPYMAIPPAAMRAWGGEAVRGMDEPMGRLRELWEEEWLPEILGHIARLETLDRIDDMLPIASRLGQLHMLVIMPATLAVSEFDELYRKLFSPEDPFEAYRLLAGLGNKTHETGTELWKLSRRALALPGVRRLLETSTASEAIGSLEKTDDGRRFLADLRRYLDEYGQRGDLWGISSPFWCEEPTPVVKTLKDYMTQPDEADPEAVLANLARRREELVALARERLAGRSEEDRGRFEFLLAAALTGIVLIEDHGFYIDFKSQYQYRRILLGIGRELVDAGSIDAPEDVFMLTLDEIRGENAPEVDRRALIGERRAEMERFAAVSPPPTLGTAPAEPPPDNAFTRAFFGKFYGSPPAPSEEAGILKGNAGAPGTARGTAKVIRSLAEASKLEPGDILVAETTAPPWTPLFAIAAAVVTDTGGILSHCAIVAREYGIPAVVGTLNATTEIADGQTLEVDGDAAVVRVLS